MKQTHSGKGDIVGRDKITNYIFSISKKTIYFIVITIFFILIGVYLYLNHNQEDEIAPLEEPRIIGFYSLTDNLARFTSSKSKQQLSSNLELEKIIQGKTKTNGSLIFDIVLKNNGEKSISPDEFIVEFCYANHPIRELSGSSTIIKPVAKYLHYLDIISDEYNVSKKTFYPVINIKPSKTVSVRYQLSYILFGQNGEQKEEDEDIIFTVKIKHDSSYLKVLPVCSWNKLQYSKENSRKNRKKRYDISNWEISSPKEKRCQEQDSTIVSFLFESLEENIACCLEAFNIDDFKN